MRQKLSILILLVLLAALLAGLNAASYVQKEKTPDSEWLPNRSSFNSGATGTQAFYTLLMETGHEVMRWQDSPAALLTAGDKAPSVFVVTGSVRREFTKTDADTLLGWVNGGGRLVVIDREPFDQLVATTANWKITFSQVEEDNIYNVDPSDQRSMTGDTAAIGPVQPTLLSARVNAIQPSRLAAGIAFAPISDGDHVPVPAGEVATPSQLAPLAHFAAGGSNLVVDAPFGNGRIVYVGDPFVVANGGINMADNAQLAINLVAGQGMIAFDEYHQGYGSDNNRFLQFFEGTPVIPIFLQLALLVGFVFFSQSRRFARPVPEPEPDRLSKLEYVSAMAELQNRTRAYDLAIENIYNDFRRRVTRYLGLDNFTARSGDIARLLSERTKLAETDIALVLFKCEEIISGEPSNKREVLELTGVLRDIEQQLGLTRTRRSRI